MSATDELLVMDKERLKEVKSILVSQPEPSDPNSPYHKLSEKYKLKIDFRQFLDTPHLDRFVCVIDFQWHILA